MALREYSAFNKSAGASILAYACNLTNMDGTLLTGTAPLYFQIHDKASAPASNDVPIKSYEITSSGPFPLASVFQTMGTIPLANGLAVGISSTANTYTAATATYSVFGEVEEGTQQIDSISGLSTIGDTTTHVDALAVWDDGASNNTNSLFRVDITNVIGAQRYIAIMPYKSGFAHPTTGDGLNQAIIRSLPSGGSLSLYFGPNGLRFSGVWQDSNNGNAVTTIRGCGIFCLTTTASLQQTGDGSMTCKAWYKTTTY